MNILHANSSIKDPFLNGFMVIDKTAVSAIFTDKDDLTVFWLFSVQKLLLTLAVG